MNASDHDHLPNPQGASGLKPHGLTHDEHWDHVAGNWSYLLLLAFPVMHLFHGHGGHGGHATSTTKPADKEE